MEAVLALRGAEFQRHPTLRAYHHLADTAAKIQADDPTPWALELLNDRVATQPSYAGELVVLRAAGVRRSGGGSWCGVSPPARCPGARAAVVALLPAAGLIAQRSEGRPRSQQRTVRRRRSPPVRALSPGEMPGR